MTHNLILGPKEPAFIQSIQYLLNPLSTLEKWNEKYGEIFKLRADSENPTIVISNPEDIKFVLSSPSNLIGLYKEDSAMKLLVGKQSIMFADGQKHRRKRKILLPSFHKESIMGYGNLISNITKDTFTSLSPYKLFSVRQITKKITLEIILDLIFGANKNYRYKKLKELFNSLNELFEFFLFEFFLAFPVLQQRWWIWDEYLQIRSKIHEILYKEIQERKGKSNVLEKDILTSLIIAIDESGQTMTSEEIHDELITIIFGGFETTSAALGWLLYWVHYLPEVKNKLIAELGSLKNDSDFMEIVKLPYLNAVVSETLRLYPIAIGPFGRKVKQSLDLRGYKLEPGNRIHISIYLAHRRPKVYSNPEEFQPERFLESAFSPYEYLPFGGGERRCLGAALATFEMKVFLMTILKMQINLALKNDELLKPVRHGIAFVPPADFEMMIDSIV